MLILYNLSTKNPEGRKGDIDSVEWNLWRIPTLKVSPAKTEGLHDRGEFPRGLLGKVLGGASKVGTLNWKWVLGGCPFLTKRRKPVKGEAQKELPRG